MVTILRKRSSALSRRRLDKRVVLQYNEDRSDARNSKARSGRAVYEPPPGGLKRQGPSTVWADKGPACWARFAEGEQGSPEGNAIGVGAMQPE